MAGCSNCSTVPALESSGTFLFTTAEAGGTVLLVKHLKDRGIEVEQENRVIHAPFHSLEEAVRIVGNLEEDLKDSAASAKGTWKNEASVFGHMMDLSVLKERISNPLYFQIINEGLFTHHMQPIIDLHTSEVMGYEFLMRPERSTHFFYPGELFEYAQKADLQSMLDSQARMSSIAHSARHLNRGTKRFINFLPSSIYDPNHCLKSTFKVVKEHGVDPADLIFEVVETEEITDVSHLQNIFKTYQQYGVNVALDDLGSGFATVEMLEKLKPDFGKVDRSLISYCDQSPEKQEKLKHMLEKADMNNIKMLAEGIERKEELEVVKQLGFHLAQGYYIGKPSDYPGGKSFITTGK